VIRSKTKCQCRPAPLLCLLKVMGGRGRADYKKFGGSARTRVN